MFLFDSGNYPYNIWETKFLENDFISKKTLEFRMAKDFCEYKKRYELILKIIFDLSLELNEEAILISNGDIELCFIKENREILLNNESGIWDNDCFRESIRNKNVSYI